jgi:hypothetical protein
MRGRMLLAKWGLVLGSGVAVAQLPPTPPSLPIPMPPASYPPGGYQPAAPVAPPGPLPPLRPVGPAMPQYPGALPPPGFPQMGNPGAYAPGSPAPSGSPQVSQNPVAQPQDFSLPQPEKKFAINAGDVSLKRVAGAWQLWAGQRMLRDFGDRENDARDAVRVYRDLRPTEWVTIGSPKPVVEYGLVNGRPPMTSGMPGAAPENPNGPASAGLSGTGTISAGVASGSGGFNNNGPTVSGAGARAVVPIDLQTVRVEAVRGVWCVRDDLNIHFNFGVNKADAEQAVAAVRRYGFNRVGVVGSPTAMSYLFAAPEGSGLPPAPQGALAKLALQAQIDGLDRVGIPVAGVGYVGEMFRFDPRKVEARKDGSEWVVAAGTEIIGRYGATEWAAREAVRTIQDSRFNEFCRVGSAGLTFFLVDGKAPTRVPFNAQGRRFDPSGLKVQKAGDRWAVAENGRHLFDCASADEGETLVRVLKHFQFDQLCQLGPTPRQGVSFLAKGK